MLERMEVGGGGDGVEEHGEGDMVIFVLDYILEVFIRILSIQLQ